MFAPTHRTLVVPQSRPRRRVDRDIDDELQFHTEEELQNGQDTTIHRCCSIRRLEAADCVSADPQDLGRVDANGAAGRSGHREQADADYQRRRYRDDAWNALSTGLCDREP